MRPEEAKEYIVSRISVTRQRVTTAQAFILNHFEPGSHPHTKTLIDQFLISLDAHMAKTVVLDPTVDPLPTLDAAAEAISWKLAICEAIWKLIGCARIFPYSAQLINEPEPSTMGWKSGGHSSGFSLSELRIGVPQKLTMARSYDPSIDQPLTNPDLYLKEIDISDLHPEIEIALREAVRCFQYDLYLPCLAMLGMASEIAWIELGLALARASKSKSPSKSDKLREEMESPFPGIAKKIQAVTKAYERKDVFGKVAEESGIKLQDLRSCIVWADCVRESRNMLHYSTDSSTTMSNNYEKVAALLIGAVPHIKILFAVTATANGEEI